MNVYIKITGSSMMNEDYFNQSPYASSVVSNHQSSMNVNSSSGLNGGAMINGGHTGQSQYFHTLQPMHHHHHHQMPSSQFINQSSNGSMGANGGAGAGYLTLNSSGMHQSQSGPVSQSMMQSMVQPSKQNSPSQSAPYMPKYISRTSSFSSSSTMSSPPSSASSSSSSTGAINGQNNAHLTISCTGIATAGSDFDHLSSPNSSLSSPTDPAEIARIKHSRNMKLTPEELQLLVKDRQRKDNHNMSNKILHNKNKHRYTKLLNFGLNSSRTAKKIQHQR